MVLQVKLAIETVKRSTSRDEDDDSKMQNTCLVLSTTSAFFLVGASLRPDSASRKAGKFVGSLKRGTTHDLCCKCFI